MDNKLREAIEKAVVIPEGQEFVAASETEHIFSDKFNKESAKLIKRQKRSYYPLICTSARRVACIIVSFLVVSMTTVLSVDALRKPFFEFIASIFSDHSEIRVDDSEAKDAPKIIEEKYEITTGLEGFNISFVSESEEMRLIEYKSGNNFIRFMQYTFDLGTANVNTENAKVEHISINGYDAIAWISNLSTTHIMWNNGEYIFNIISDVGQDALIDIAKSVQKIE